jgi:lipopolysaccharide heptosyltransferase II
VSWLHLGRDALDRAATFGFAAYGVWSWINGPRPSLPLEPGEVRRILVIRLDLLGDVVFSIPTIEALAEAFPGAEIDVLTLPFSAPVVRGHPSVRDVFTIDVNQYRRPRGWRRLGELRDLLQELRGRRYDLAVGLSRRLGGVFAVLSGARLRLGYTSETYAGCYNLPVPGGRYEIPQHEVTYCLDLVRALGVAAEDADPHLHPARASSELVPRPYLVLVPGASNGAAKRWPTPYWSRLANAMGERYGVHVVLSGADSERALVGAVARETRVPHSDLSGRTSTEELLDLLAGARMVIAGDTGPLHVASALEVPVVGIFGPTDPINTGPRSAQAEVVRLGLPCSPCYDLRSPADCKLPDRSTTCMWGITPELVLEAVDRVLQRAPGVEAVPGGTQLDSRAR